MLIVGAGQAAVEVATTLRKGDEALPITMVGAESSLPYQRPPLSKQFLTGEMHSDGLALRPPAFYEQNDITVLTGTNVTAVDLDKMSAGGVAVTDSGRELGFTDLVFATGARARRLGVPGSDLAGVLYLRDLADASALRVALERAKNVVVVGGGFIGLETAVVAAAAGKRTHVVEAGARLLGRVVAPVVSDFYRDAHSRRGVNVLLGAEVSGIEGARGVVTAVLLGDGTRLDADLVLVGIGAEARTELASRAGVHCQKGIVVDDLARTDRRGVFAAGDCTVQPHPGRIGEPHVRLESVQNAIDQARAAAATVLGVECCQPTVPRFWSNQGDLRLQTVGFSTGWDQLVVRGSLHDEKFSVLYFRDRELIAADAVNLSADFAACRIALVRGTAITPEAAGTVPELRALVA
ncbi:FAD-dependent oxidoreductase [Streptomyces scabiei]|uniref:NAD(P)/FAD-dependent oxidoreductase n=1 Tax=Streptomyces scabiei TaxID=1930 RepID=UPI0029ADF00A|nr:FAD-dependent oxidoreductase [Streptomyces scabiei]MDX3522706.1 FAD-dependent oxidoreductase [Streptomyces scabiei]